MSETDFSRATWRKSARSGNNGNCVEVALTQAAIGVRDSKNREGETLAFTPREWRTFIDSVRDGLFDL